MKIGIISEFEIRTLNYGNHLQAYALNHYINCEMNHNTESIVLKPSRLKALKIHLTNPFKVLKKVIYRKFIRNKKVTEGKRVNLEMRYQAFAHFAKKNIKLSKEMGWQDLCESDYDCFIVGSDIVWYQYPGLMRRVKWLDFRNKKNAIKVAYAASMGRDWIPKENYKSIRRYLKDFKAISVRESSTVGLFDELKLGKTVHVLDPTLLLNEEEWTKIEKRPDGMGAKEKGENCRYVFAYLLSADHKVRMKIQKFCHENNLTLVNIPYKNQIWTEEEEKFGDVQVMNCSPQEWIWLIHHAEYIFTDSFHGVVFSTIFQRRFLIVERQDYRDISNRINDYIALINQQDKRVELLDDVNINLYHWDYDEIYKKIKPMIDSSKEYLESALS